MVGAISSVKTEEFGDVVVGNVAQLVQGKMAGVQVVNNSGLPGAGSRIIVRGIGSFTNGDPLYVIDGIQGGFNEFNSISPYDVAEVTVLKDAVYTAIYGARAANGVVIVTTKRAKTGEPRVTYNGYYGLGQPWKKIDVLNASQYIDLVEDFAVAQNVTLPAKLTTPEARVDRTDWQDAIFRTAHLTEHHLNVSGGTDKITYNISGGYTHQEAIIEKYDFKRYNLRLNLEQNLIKNRVKLGQVMNLRYAYNEGQTAGFLDALRYPPYAPIFDPTNLGGLSRVTTVEDLNDGSNPLTDVLLRERKSREMLAYFQFYGELRIFDWLKFRSQLAVPINGNQNYNYRQANRNGNLLNATNIDESYGWSYNTILENFLTFNRTWGVHNISAVVGNTYITGGRYRSVDGTGSDFPNDEITQVGVAPSRRLTGAFAGQGTSGISYFGRVEYNLMDRYLLTASIRRDGSPQVSKNNRFGNFPAFGVGWKISEERFMEGVPFLSALKLRSSYGITGNDNIGLFRDQSLVFRGLQNNLLYSLGPDKTMVQGSTVNQPINPNLRWEQTTQFDVGLDAGLFNQKLQLTVDYYDRNSEGLLVDVPIPLSTGLGGPYDRTGLIPLNAASAVNRGVETTASYAGKVGAFTFNVGGNLSHNYNEVLSLGTEGANPIRRGGFEAVSNSTFTDAGLPIGSFWGFKVAGVAVDQAQIDALNAKARETTGEADAVYQALLLPGDLIFQDLDGDGQVTEDGDQGFLGSPMPKWTYGFNFTVNYKGFDLMATAFGLADVKVLNSVRYWSEGMTRPFNADTDVLRRWRQPGDVTDIPRAGQNVTGSLNLRPSDRFIEDGSFLRVRNVTLGYTLPRSVLNQLTGDIVSNFRLYVTAQNLFTFTNYSGYDPEISAQDPNSASSNIFSRGIDNGQYPQPRSFLFGVQLGF